MYTKGTKTVFVNIFTISLELDALGDDFLEDESYLDSLDAPEPPSKVPGGTDTVKSKVSIYFITIK